MNGHSLIGVSGVACEIRRARSLVLGLCMALVAAVLALPAAGQPYMDGLEHPEYEALGDEDREIFNPFGDPEAPSRASAAEKRAFSNEVDLEPLRDLSVFHAGRVKILDTLSREMVSRITGRGSYREEVEVNGSTRTHAYDPLFTLMDLSIDPLYYVDRPLVHVDFLPFRRALIRHAVPMPQGASPEQQREVERERDRMLRQGRVSPELVMRFGPHVRDEHMFEEPYRNSFDRAAVAVALWEQAFTTLKMVAPESQALPWIHLSDLPDGHPVRDAAAQLGASWRDMDAAGVNEAVAELAELLPSLNAAQYPGLARELELMYNRTNAFQWGYWVYFISLVALLLAFGTGRRWLTWVGVTTLIGAIGLHAFGFVIRCIVAERFAIQNQFESMTGLSLFGALVGLAIMVQRRQWLFGAAAAGMGFLVLIVATETGMPGATIGREAAILNTSVLLKYHVTTVLVSYGLITLGFLISLFYLWAYYGSRGGSGAVAGQAQPLAGGKVIASALGMQDSRGVGVNMGTQRMLRDLDTAHMTVLQLAFWTLGVGILLGAWWADHSWGRWWAFDPKETWALITWIVYLVVIHVRMTVKNRGLVTAWLSILGFIVMLWTYFGVNLLLPGLHSYA